MLDTDKGTVWKINGVVVVVAKDKIDIVWQLVSKLDVAQTGQLSPKSFFIVLRA